MYNIHQPGAPIVRGTQDRKKKDRIPVVRYGARGHELASGMSRGEEFLLEPPHHLNGRDRYLMGTIPAPDLQHPLPTRPSLVALLVVSVTQGSDILVDQNGSIDHEVRALLAHYALHSGRDLIITSAPASRRLTRARQLRDFQQHVGEDRLRDTLITLFEAAAPQLARAVQGGQAVHELLHVAGEPPREFGRAAAAARELRVLGWSQNKIGRYLTLHGFANSSGTVGVWSHGELKKLGS